MKRSRMLSALSFLVGSLAVASGCGDTGLVELSFPVQVQGTAARAVTVGEWTVTLERAEIGLGPVYFCATAAIDPELCSTAVADFAQSVRVDLLRATTTVLGQGQGVSAEVRGLSFDYGVSWLTTQGQATPSSAAPEGHSAVLAGRAQKGDVTLRFTFSVDVAPLRRGGRAVNGLATEVTLKPGTALTLRFDPSAWLAAVSFDELLEKGGEPVVVDSTMRAYSAVVTGMLASAPPSLTWTTP